MVTTYDSSWYAGAVVATSLSVIEASTLLGCCNCRGANAHLHSGVVSEVLNRDLFPTHLIDWHK